MKKIAALAIAVLIALSLAATTPARGTNPQQSPLPIPTDPWMIPNYTPCYCRPVYPPTATTTPQPHKEPKAKTTPLSPGMRYWFWLVYGR